GTMPSSVKTTINKAFISFHSDSAGNRTGFSLTWSTLGSIGNNICGGHFSNDSGSIQYPVTGSNYPENVNCSWVIVSSGANIELEFTSINTEPGTDFVYIRDGESISAPELGNYSGVTLPSSVKTTSNKAFIHFTSDALHPSKGFALIWNIVDDNTDMQASTLPMSTTLKTEAVMDDASTFIIIGAIIAIFLIVVIATTIFFCLKKRKNQVISGQQELPLENLSPNQSDPGMGNHHDSENSLYDNMGGSIEEQVPNRDSRHESENSLYSATMVPNRGSRHDSENSLYGAIIARDA
ncbi:unnamed protein product, partial [Meganyctiphanes norvegica]